MPTPNPDRNRDLFPFWQERRTIEEASLLTGIPRSTVGYYYKKYKRYAKEGRPVVIPQATQEKSRTKDLPVLAKSMIIGSTMQMIASDPERAYYILSVFKLLKELNLEITLEELEALQKSPRPSIGAPLEARTEKKMQTAAQIIERAEITTLPTTTTERPDARQRVQEILSVAAKEYPQEFLEVLRRILAQGKTSQ